MKSTIPQIGTHTEITEELKEKIRSLITEAGGARFVANECEVSYDTYHNVLRGLSSDFPLVQKMIDKAKEILADKDSKPVIII